MLPFDPITFKHLFSVSEEDSHWSINSEGLLHLDNHIYVPEANDLHLQVLHNKHDHPLSGYFE